MRPQPESENRREPRGLTHELRTVRALLPYIWPRGAVETKIRVVIAIVLLIAAKLATDSDALTAYARELAQGTVDVMSADDHSDYLADPAGWEDGLSMQLGEAFTQDKIADESLQEEIQREYLSLITEILEAQTAAPTKDQP